MKTISNTSRLFAAVTVLAFSSDAFASNQTWVNTGSTSASWANTDNWSSAAPGNTTSGATPSTDVATFNSAVGANTYGSSGTPITIDSGRTISGMTFDTSSVGAFTIGTAGGNSLYLSSGGAIQTTATAITNTETINAPLVIVGANGTYSFINNGTSTGLLNFGGQISGGTAGATVLTLDGSNAGNNTVSGAIVNGTATTLGVTKTGAGTWILTGANTYTGATTINRGTLNLGGSGATGSISSSSALALGGGALSYTVTGNQTQSFASTAINSGASSVSAVAGDTISLGAITRSVGGTVDFSSTGTIDTATNTNVNGILGGYATFGGSTWAVAPASSGGAITGLATYVTTTTAGTTAATYSNANIDVTSSAGTLGGVITPNSLRFNNAGARTVTLATGTNVIGTGGILVTSTVGNNASSITGGTLEGAAGKDLVVINNDTSSSLTISSVIADNTSATGLTKSGAGTLALTAANTYTGNTVVNAGALTITGSIAGNVTVNGGGTLNFGSGSGTTGSVAGTATLNNGATEVLNTSGGIFPNTATTISGLNAAVTLTSKSASGAFGGAITGTADQTINISGAGGAAVNITAATLTNFAGTVNIASGASMADRGAETSGSSSALFIVNGSINKKANNSNTFNLGMLSGSGTLGGATATTVSTTNTYNIGGAGTAWGTQTFSGTIIDGGGTTFFDSTKVNKIGAGTEIFSGANTYTGATAINAGTLGLSGSGTLGTGSALTMGGGTLDLGTLSITVGAVSITTAAASGNTIQNGSLTGTSYAASNTTSNAIVTANLLVDGSAGLTKSGAGTLTLSGANTYTGGTAINAGTVQVGNGAGLGASSGGVSVASGAVLDLNGTTMTNTNALTLNGTGISSGGALINSNATAATYAGLVTLGSASSLVASGGNLTLSNTGTITGAGDNLTLGGGNNGSIASVIGTTTGSLTMSGSGTWTLSGANTFSGVTTVSSGTLALGNNLALQNSTLSTSGGGAVNATGFTAPTIGGLTGSANLASVITSGYGSITNLTLNPGAGISDSYSGVIADGATGMTLTKTGTGTQTLTGTNTYTGGTLLNGGTLNLAGTAGTSALGTGTITMANGTTLGNTTTIAAGFITNAITITGTNAVVTLTQANTSSGFSGAITGSADQTINIVDVGSSVSLSSSTQQLSGFAGTVSIGAGNVLAFRNVNLNDGGPGLFVDNGTITTRNNGVVALGALSGSGFLSMGTAGGNNANVTYNIGAAGTNFSPENFSGIISDGNAANGQLVFINKVGAGTQQFSGANTYTGGTTVSAGTLQIGSATALGGSAGNVSVTSGAVLDLNGTTMTNTNALTLNGTGISSGGALINSSATAGTYAGLVTLGSASSIVAGTGNITLSSPGTITGGFGLTLGGAANGSIASNIGTGAGTVTKNGTGTWTLSGADTYTGGTTINAGTLAVGSSTALGAATNAAVTFGASSTGTLSLNGFNTTVTGLNTNVTVGSPVVQDNNATSATLTVNTTANSAYAGALQDGATGTLALVKSGSGTLTLSGADSFTGGTTINAGTLEFASTTSMSPSGTVTANSGALLAIEVGSTGSYFTNATSGNGSIGGVFSNVGGQGGPVTLNAGSAVGIDTTNATAGTITYGGNITNAGVNLTKLGTGTLVLTGSNSYSGGTTITSAGTLQVGNGGTTGSLGTGGVANSGALIYDVNGPLTDNNVISGTGSLTQNGTGTLTLGGASTYTGNTSVNAGALTLTNALGTSGTPSGAITVNAGLLNVSGATVYASQLVTNDTAGAGTVAMSSGTVTLSGTLAINNTGGTYTAGVALTGGTLNANSLAIGRDGITTQIGGSPVFSDSFTTDGLYVNGGTLNIATTFNAGTASGNQSSANARMDSGSITVNGTTTISTNDNNSRMSLLDINGGTFTSNDTTGAGMQVGSAGTSGDGAGEILVSGTGLLKTTTITLGASGQTSGADYFVADGGTTYIGSGGIVAVGTGPAQSAYFGGSTVATTPIIGASANWSSSVGIVLANSSTGAAPIIQAADASSVAHNITLSGALTGTGGLNKTGTGTLALQSASNTYSGVTTITAGTLQISSTSNIGGTAGGVTFNGGTLQYTSGASSGTDLTTASHVVTLAAGGGTIDTNGNAVEYAHSIGNSGSGGLTLSDSNGTPGSLTLDAVNTYTGATTIVSGTLLLNDLLNNPGNDLATSSGVNLTTSAAAFDISQGYSQTIKDLTGVSGSTIYLGNNNLTAGTSNSTTFAGVMKNGGAGGGTGATFTKQGSGTLTLAGANLYTGATSVKAGTLSVTGSLAGGSSAILTVGGSGASSTPTLNGTGTINGKVIVASAGGGVAGTIMPGTASNLYGTMTIGGTISFQTGSNFIVNLSGSNSGELVIGGAATIGSGADITINVGSSLTQSSYTLATAASGLNSGSFTVLGSLPVGYSLSYTSTAVTLSLATNTNGQYTLTTTAGSLNVHANGGSTTLATTIANTGTGTQDALNYSSLTATATSGTVGTATGNASGTNLAQGANNSPGASETYTAGSTAGNVTIGNSATVTNHSGATGTPVATNTGTTINVFSGLSTWNTNGGGSWSTAGTGAFGAGANWGANQGAPGVTAGFANTDTATFDNSALTAGSNATVTLDGASPSLKAVTFNTQAGSGYTIAQGTGGNLALYGNGGNATVTVTSGNQTISAPVSLTTGADVNVASGQKMTFSGALSGSGSLNVVTGSGTTELSNATGNTYTGGTTVSAGTLVVSNTSNSGTGTGAVTVNSGGTLAGNGIISTSSGMTVNGGGSLVSGSRSQISGTGLSTVGGLAVVNTAVTIGSSIGTANLTFDLGSGTSGINGGTASGAYDFSNPNNNTTYLSLSGSSSINFAGATSLSLVDLTNTTGSNGSLALRLASPYLLIHAGSNADYLNLVVNIGTAANPIYTLSQNDASANGFVMGVWAGGSNPLTDYTAISITEYGADGTTPLTSQAGGIYYAPALYLDGGNLEVVPEPGTWALMIGGFALLVVIQRRRSKQG